MGKKKRVPEGAQSELLPSSNGDSSQKRKKKKKTDTLDNDAVSSKSPTVSIAVPGSIIDNAQSLELATRLAGQIARAATIFRVDEVVVFDNASTSLSEPSSLKDENSTNEDESGAVFLLRILRYLETPQYLRKSLFPKHNSLRFVGLLPPLDAPHHLRRHEWGPYREGTSRFSNVEADILVLRPGDGELATHVWDFWSSVTIKSHASDSGGATVDVGLHKNVVVDQILEAGKRVTVAMGTNRNLDTSVTYQVVPSSKPMEEAGTYWGYKVRYASNISTVFSGCPYEGGYDYLIGTSEHGAIVKSSELVLPSFRHLLIAFGGLAGLEECVEIDKNMKGKSVQDVFQLYLNICPHQGSRTIRTEEAVFICMQYFQEPIERASQK